MESELLFVVSSSSSGAPSGKAISGSFKFFSIFIVRCIFGNSSNNSAYDNVFLVPFDLNGLLAFFEDNAIDQAGYGSSPVDTNSPAVVGVVVSNCAVFSFLECSAFVKEIS